MKHLHMLLGALMLITVCGCPGGGGGDSKVDDDPPKPLMGMLQFRILHNLQDDGCLTRGDCFYAIEEEDETAEWLTLIAADSNLAVLHWDRAVPWLAFDADPPAETSRTQFFDARIDDGLRAWIDAFAAHFASLPFRYLAVTPLHGLRNKLERCRINQDLEVEITAACPMWIPARSYSFSTTPAPARERPLSNSKEVIATLRFTSMTSSGRTILPL